MCVYIYIYIYIYMCVCVCVCVLCTCCIKDYYLEIEYFCSFAHDTIFHYFNRTLNFLASLVLSMMCACVQKYEGDTKPQKSIFRRLAMGSSYRRRMAVSISVWRDQVPLSSITIVVFVMFVWLFYNFMMLNF